MRLCQKWHLQVMWTSSSTRWAAKPLWGIPGTILSSQTDPPQRAETRWSRSFHRLTDWAVPILITWGKTWKCPITPRCRQAARTTTLTVTLTSCTCEGRHSGPHPRRQGVLEVTASSTRCPGPTSSSPSQTPGKEVTWKGALGQTVGPCRARVVMVAVIQMVTGNGTRPTTSAHLAGRTRHTVLIRDRGHRSTWGAGLILDLTVSSLVRNISQPMKNWQTIMVRCLHQPSQREVHFIKMTLIGVCFPATQTGNTMAKVQPVKVSHFFTLGRGRSWQPESWTSRRPLVSAHIHFLSPRKRRYLLLHLPVPLWMGRAWRQEARWTKSLEKTWTKACMPSSKVSWSPGIL